MKLRTQIVLPLLLVAAILGAGAVAAVVQVGQGEAINDARDGLAARTALLGQDIGDAVRARSERVALLAFAQAETDATTDARDVTPAEADTAHAQLAALLRDASRGLFARVAVLGADGTERAAYAAGVATAPSPTPPGQDAAFAALARDPLAAPVVRVAPGAEPGLTMSAAFVDAQARFAGVVRGEVPLAALVSGSIPGLPAARTALVAADGAPVGGAPLPDAVASSLRQARATSGVADGWLFAVAPAARLPDGTTWSVAATMPIAAVTSGVLPGVLPLGAALVAVALGGAVVVALVVRRALQPLERLSGAVAGLGAGPPGGHVAPEGADELRTLAGAFNAMVDRLQEREATLAREFASREQHAKFATLGSLSAGVAHEIKNPLTGMKLQTQLLRDLASRGAADPARVARAAGRMLEVNQRGIERIEKVVASLSMLARPRPEVEAVDVAQVAEASAALAGARLRGREVRIEVPAGLKAVASADGLGQVLLNLVANAADAAPRDTGKVLVTAARVGDRVRIAVEDNGPGIPPEVAARIGEPFFTTKEGGTGLGLSISARIANELGGSLRFEDREEGGARFLLELAAADPQPDAP
ncbi:MAG: HAMP domain-containing histidine kinase [Halobacteriales archaeon]|nr:HAMP domain-containing histidine kinase [Halobacteriales archaeon]